MPQGKLKMTGQNHAHTSVTVVPATPTHNHSKGKGIFKDIRSTMKELHKQHRNKLEDITHRFESIKLTLSEKVESLRGECDDLRHRARASEDALQRDADVKVQMALAPFLNLPQEIESLKTVVDMRNEEIQKLRTKNMDLEKQLEEVPIAREKIISLQQKVENLEAIINIKSDHEKQLHEKCQVLMRKYDRESRANKRLSMDYEQVMWRMSQSSEFGSSESLTKRQLSRSPPRSETTSPDPRRRTLSPTSNGEVRMRVRTKSGNGEPERRMRTRSATFVLESDETLDSSRSPSASPRVKQKLQKKIGGHLEDGLADPGHRMCMSAGPEVISGNLEPKQTWVEPGQTLNLNDTADSVLMSSGEMMSSYAKSESAVSDSGMYDSLSRSEMLNSSMISTDSEWVASTSMSMTLDSTVDESDLPGNVEEQVSAEHDTTVIPSNGAVAQGADGHISNGPNTGKYEFQISLPGNEDNVFDESASLEHCTYIVNQGDGGSVNSSNMTTPMSELSSLPDDSFEVSTSVVHQGGHENVPSSSTLTDLSSSSQPYSSETHILEEKNEAAMEGVRRPLDVEFRKSLNESQPGNVEAHLMLDIQEKTSSQESK